MATETLSETSWRSERPFLGAVLLMVSGLIVGYVPIQFTFELILIGGAFTAIGLLFAVLIFLTGVFALLRPDLSTILGVAGVAFSILSVVGALGGLLIGLLIGIVGSNLLIAWRPPGERGEPTATPTGAGTTTGAAGGTDFSWESGTGAGAGTTAPTAGTGFEPEPASGPASEPASGPASEPASEPPFESPTETDTGPADEGSEGSVDFSWQEDPDARTGTGAEDVGTSFDAEREPTVEEGEGEAEAEDEEEDEDDEDDGRVDFSWE